MWKIKTFKTKEEVNGMMRNEMFELVQQWMKRMDELHPDVPKDKLYFNVNYNQMRDILKALENGKIGGEYCDAN